MSNQSAQIPYLVMYQGPRPQQIFSLKKNLLTLGRDADNDIVINDAEISRHHARLTWQGDRWVIEDLGSSNGTFINGQRISGPTILAAGSQLQLGPDVVFGMQVGAPGAVPKPRKRKMPLALGIAGAVTLGVLVLGILAALGYFYFSGSWPFGLSQSAAVNSGPTVVIQNPAPAIQVTQGDSFMVFVSSHDDAGVVRIDLWVDDLLLLTQSSPDDNGLTHLTLSYPLVAVESGNYALIARAYNSQGDIGESAVHHVIVYEVAASQQHLAQYTVQEGDTLENIAGKAGTQGPAIAAANPHITNNQVKPGQSILVPVQPPPPSRAVPPPAPPAAPPPAPPPPINQPALTIKNLNVLTSPVFYGQACTNEPTTTGVVLTIDPATAVKSTTLKFVYYGKAGKSGELFLPMTLSGGQFKADINAGGEAEKYLAQDGGWMLIWAEVLGTDGKTSISKPASVTAVFCASIAGPGNPPLPPGMPGILPGLLPGAAGQAGQAGVFQPGQGPASGIVANILPQWNPINVGPQVSAKPPASTQAKLATDCQVTITWKDDSTNEKGYELYRYDPGAPRGKLIKELPADTESFDDKVPVPGKYGYKVAVKWMDGNTLRLTNGPQVSIDVPASQNCQPLPGFQRILFRLLSFVPSDSSLTWGFIEATVRGLPTIRIPDASNVRTGNLADYSTFTRSMPAPESFYTDPDSLLFIEFQGNATADAKKNPPTALGQFADSHSYTDMAASDARTAVWKTTDKGFAISYSIWMENWFWGGRSQANPKVPAPYNLKLTTSGAEHRLTWEFAPSFNPKFLDGFIIYRNYICPGADVAMKYPLAVGKSPQMASISVVDAPLGCKCAYSVSAYGSQGESLPSKPQQEACKTNDPIDSVVVTFESLTIKNALLPSPTSASVQLFANEYTRLSGIQLLEAKTYQLKDMHFNGRADKNSIIVNLGPNKSLTVNLSFYVSNLCQGINLLLNKSGDGWLPVIGNHTLTSADGNCQVVVSLLGRSVSGQSSSGAPLGEDGGACKSNDQCKSGICQSELCAPAVIGVENAYCFLNSHCISGLCVCEDEDGNEVTCPASPQAGDGGKCSAGLPLAARCTSSSQCGSGNCANGICAPLDGRGQIGDYCHHNNQCANHFCFCPDSYNGDFCSNYDANADFLNRRGTCAPNPGWPNGSACDDNSDCMSNYCANGLCAPRDDTGVAGEYCHHNNHCVSGTCNCPSGEANFWTLGFCPDWQKFDTSTHGTCEP